MLHLLAGYLVGGTDIFAELYAYLPKAVVQHRIAPGICTVESCCVAYQDYNVAACD
jgi:hypothetical protein